MFEHATLSNGPASKRVWTTCLGISSQALVVAGMILTPLVFPQVLPRVEGANFVWLGTPPPPPPPAGPSPKVQPRSTQAHTRPLIPFHETSLKAPIHIPTNIAMIDDVGDAPSSGEIGGVPGGVRGGVTDGIIGGVLNKTVVAPPPPPPFDPVHVQPMPVSIPRVPQSGGRVKIARVLHRVEPIYPAMARQMRISGDVEIEGVISVDGRMIELKAKSGHPFLVKAALDAVSQWIYEPTTLNGQPVEVIAPIHVTFRLN
jgi:protein TonB